MQTRPEGLTQEEVAERLRRYGRNAIREVKGKPLIVKFLANFTHIMAILLWAGGIAAFVAQMPQLGWAVWAVNLINGVFSFWQEFKAEKATEALRQLLPSYARVLRQGEEQRILAEELVPGDVMLLEEGDRISADARLVQESELRADQSTLSGESHPVRKTSEAVLSTGAGSRRNPQPGLCRHQRGRWHRQGHCFRHRHGHRVRQDRPPDAGVGDGTEPAAEGNGARDQSGDRDRRRHRRCSSLLLAVALAGVNLAESFIFAVGMIVAFVPEGMLPTVTLSLAMGVQRMAKRHALIKRLSAVETLGCTTVICTDKTGTLTQNEMTVRHLWLAREQLLGHGRGLCARGEDPGLTMTKVVDSSAHGDLRQLLVAGGLCNNARLLPPDEESDRWTVLGDPTEAALRVVAAKGGVSLDDEARCAPCLRQIPFESRRKRMTTIHQIDETPVAYVKGAPKEILGLCTRIRIDGQERPLDDDWRSQIAAANDEYARNGLRVLAIAIRPVPELRDRSSRDAQATAEAIERDLTFVGLVAMMDPPRPEVSMAVEKCYHAGIRIIMITGDYGLTAETIARRIGIVRGPQVRIITGVDLDAMTDEALEGSSAR